jgi:hypothetical protein
MTRRENYQGTLPPGLMECSIPMTPREQPEGRALPLSKGLVGAGYSPEQRATETRSYLVTFRRSALLCHLLIYLVFSGLSTKDHDAAR